MVLDLLAEQDGACYLPADIATQMKAVQVELFPVVDAAILKQKVVASYPASSSNRGLIEETLRMLREHAVID